MLFWQLKIKQATVFKKIFMKKLLPFFYIVLVCFANACTAQQSAFVKVNHNQFELNANAYKFIGTNMWYATILAMPDSKGGDRKRLLKELDFLKTKCR